MRRPRIRLRTLMVIVAIVAASLGGLAARLRGFARLSERHQAAARALHPLVDHSSMSMGPYDPSRVEITNRYWWHVNQAGRFRNAASGPWPLASGKVSILTLID